MLKRLFLALTLIVPLYLLFLLDSSPQKANTSQTTPSSSSPHPKILEKLKQKVQLNNYF